MNQTTNSQNNKLMISILVFVMLLHMLWNTISAYIKGGNEAKAISAQKTTVDEESSDMNISD